ncbi:MAG: glycoside hydrolase family 5 protein [Ruminococcus sp.]|nr:glycoside hydrolase family 5 protein [Ruminococcus sp.]
MAKAIMKKLLAAAGAMTMMIVPGNASLPATTANSADNAPDSYHDDWLHVNENAEIVDMYGNPVWMTGCNWFGYNVTTQCFDGVWSRNMHEMLNEMADHGFNLMRVPMSTQILLQWKNHDPDPYMVKINEWKNPELTVEGIEGGKPKYSFDIWNQAVEWCRENGIKIMIDIHCATTASNGHQYPLWYDSNYSYDDWLEALNWVADYYKDDDTIIAIDLKNEPHGKNDGQGMAKWDDSKDDNNWKYAAERGANAVLSANPNLLVMVEGIEVYPKFEEGEDWDSQPVDYARYPWSPFYGAWWGGNFRGARKYPVNLGKYQSQLVYSPHDYGPLVWEQDWFKKDFTRETLLDDYWRDSWAYLIEEKISPLLMGEWGGFIDKEHDPTGDNTKWMTILRDYMIEKRIHHTFWCFNENSGDTGGLLTNDFQKWDEDKYALVKPALWQDENGKFISLDHQVPMGKSGNGISLSDYYKGSSGPKVEPTTPTTEPTTATEAPKTILYGDANCSGDVKMNDAVLIMQAVANPDLYDVGGTAESALTPDGYKNADCYDPCSSLTSKDALSVQKALIGTITLPETE